MLTIENNKIKRFLPAVIHGLAAFVVALCTIELFFVQSFRVPDNTQHDLLYGPTPFLLMPGILYILYLPFSGRLRKTFASMVNKKPLFISIGKNTIKAVRLDDESVSIDINRDFSSDDNLIWDNKTVTQALCDAFKHCFTGTSWTPAPYVIVSTSKALLPPEEHALNQALKQAGARKVIYMNENANSEEAMQFSKSNPYT